MKCPNCEAVLIEKKVGGITVDLCEEGCRGVWFDNFELSKVDEAHEAAGEELIRLSPPHPHHTPAEGKRPCPRCAGVFMRRFFSSVQRAFEMDECPNCAGVWLDAGELAHYRAEHKTDEERDVAAAKHFAAMFDRDLAATAAASTADRAARESFARAVKYVLPSYWIPGKQKGGAF